MKLNYKLLLSAFLITLITGCSGKSFTMQEYADKWFNDKNPETSKEVKADKVQEKEVDVVEPKEEEKHFSKQETEKEPEVKPEAVKEEPTVQAEEPTQKVETIKAPTQEKEVIKLKEVEVNEAVPIQKEKSINPGKSEVGASIAPSSVNKRDARMEGQGAMQTNLDTWTKEKWEPVFVGDEEQAEKDRQADEHFTIQHYIDKYHKYSASEKEKWENTEGGKPEANYEKMNRLPVIGK